MGWKAYVVPHTHSDFAWAASMARCMDANVEAVAHAVALCEQDPDFRYTVEHVLAVREYVRRNPERTETLRRLLAEGRLDIGGFYTGPWELTSGAESLIRQLYYGKLWVRQNLGFDAQTVWNVDVAGHTAQLPQILQKAGIRGFVISAGEEGLSLFDWQGRDGSSVRTWTTLWFYCAAETIGLRKEDDLGQAVEKMPQFLAEVRKHVEANGLPTVAFIADGFDIALPSAAVARNVRRWNEEKREPPMEVATTACIFDAIAGHRLPAYAGEMPSPWDTVQSQGLDCFMPDRHLDERVLAAEKLCAFLGVADPAFDYPQSEFDRIWQDRLLVYDHNWGGTDGAANNRLKAETIAHAADLTDGILDRAFGQLSGSIRFAPPTPDAIPIVVFNPLSWPRREVVECVLPIPAEHIAKVAIADRNGTRIPLNRLSDQADSLGTCRVAFSAEAPSLGYATYYAFRCAEPFAPAPWPFECAPGERVFESPAYRVEIDADSSGIRSILHKPSGRELLRQDSRYTFGELAAFEDDEVDIRLHLTGRHWSSRERPSTVRVVEEGPVRLILEVQGGVLESSARYQRITLYPDSDRIDLETRLQWEGKRNVQLYQEFPLAGETPRVRYAIPYGWEEYGQEMPYAAPWPFGPLGDRPWRGMRGWVELSDGGGSIALATDCNYAAFRDLAPERESGVLVQPLLLRSIRSCGDDQLFYGQPGSHTFRFALRPNADPARLGAELDAPLMPFVPAGIATDSGTLPDCLSFLRVSPDTVQVTAAKRAEDGEGIILRLVEMARQQPPTITSVQLFRPVEAAEMTDIIEQGGRRLECEAGTVRISMQPAGIETIRVHF